MGGKMSFTNRKTTFRYMDGAAELYRSYGFKLLMVRLYMKEDHPPIILKLLISTYLKVRLGIVFSLRQGDEEVGIGKRTPILEEGYSRFWKGKFFVNVYARTEAPSTKKDVLDWEEPLPVDQTGRKKAKIDKPYSKKISTEGYTLFPSHRA